MASNNFYGNTHSYGFNESLRPPGSSQLPSNTSSRNDLDSISNNYSTPSPYRSLTPAPSYESIDRPPYFQSQDEYSGSENGSAHTNDQYADNIPLKPSKHTPLRTDWRAENREYPASLESQREQGVVQPPQTITTKKKGWFSGKVPWVVYVVSTVQIAVFIVEIVRNCSSSNIVAKDGFPTDTSPATLTGSPIMIHPQFNPMIGPSTYVLINMGARFVPCMRTTPGVQNSTTPIPWFCPNST